MSPAAQERIAVAHAIVGRLAAFIVAGVLIYYIHNILLAILSAVVLASSVEPVIRMLMAKRVPRTVSVVGIYATILAIFLAGIVYVLPILATEISGLLQALPSYLDEFALSSPGFLGFENSIEIFSHATSFLDYLAGTAELIRSVGGNTYEFGSALFGGVSTLIIIGVLSFYLSTQEDGVGDFLRIITPLKYERYVIGLWRRSQRNIARWMQGQIFLAAIIGVLAFIGLSALGVRHALLLAIIAAFFEIIPVFGPILGSIPGIAIGFLDGGVSLALLVAALFVIIQQLESHVIYPAVVRKVIGVPPLVVIISLIIGLKLGGILGAILSIPVATLLIEYLGDRERNRRIPIPVEESPV
jgi:predicted PurR-regulated permease PerM